MKTIGYQDACSYISSISQCCLITNMVFQQCLFYFSICAFTYACRPNLLHPVTVVFPFVHWKDVICSYCLERSEFCLDCLSRICLIIVLILTFKYSSYGNSQVFSSDGHITYVSVLAIVTLKFFLVLVTLRYGKCVSYGKCYTQATHYLAIIVTPGP